MTTNTPHMSSLPDGVRTEAFLDGGFTPAENGATLTTPNPATGADLMQIAACSVSDVDRAVRSARRAFDGGAWSRSAPTHRKRVLLAFADLIEAHAEELALTEAIDAGKPISDCRDIDIPDVVGAFRWYAEAIDKVFGKTAPGDERHIGLIVKEPLGVIGAVLPWNFPMSMLSWKLAPALAAGNSVVVKPPELASLTTLRLAELAYEAGLPRGVFNAVPGHGHITGKALGQHPDIDAIAFTGSTEVGREFLRYSAGSNLKEVVLEMGGKSPQIVMADCRDRLEEVAEDLVDAAFWNAGQNCTAGSRILVDAGIVEDFTSAFVKACENLVVGEPTDPETTTGPLIEAAALDRVMASIEQAKADGAVIASGGVRVLEESGGWYVAPTVLTGVTPDMSVARDEIFGPLVAIMTFDDVNEAVRMANDTTYGLAATVWSRDIDLALTTARRLRAGTVAINGYSEGDITTPFGGYRQSGFGGRDNGLEAFDQYTETKTIWITLHGE